MSKNLHDYIQEANTNRPVFKFKIVENYEGKATRLRNVAQRRDNSTIQDLTDPIEILVQKNLRQVFNKETLRYEVYHTGTRSSIHCAAQDLLLNFVRDYLKVMKGIKEPKKTTFFKFCKSLNNLDDLIVLYAYIKKHNLRQNVRSQEAVGLISTLETRRKNDRQKA